MTTSEQPERPDEIPAVPEPDPAPEMMAPEPEPGPAEPVAEPEPAAVPGPDPTSLADPAPEPEPGRTPKPEPEPEPTKPTGPTAAETAAANAARAVEVGSAGLHAAVSVFTWLPVPPVELDRDTARRAMLALPWVGLGAGLVAATAAAVVMLLGAGDLLAAIIGLGVLTLASGGMHLTGAARTADGLGSGRPAAEALALMRAPGIGVLGVVAVFFVLGLDAAALASPHLVGTALPAALITAPLVGRVAAYAGTGRWAQPARPDGLGARFVGVTSDLALMATGLAAAATTVLIGGIAQGFRGIAVFLLAALVTWTLAAIWQRHQQRRLGGTTGDTLGALVELGQAAFLVVLALAL